MASGLDLHEGLSSNTQARHLPIQKKLDSVEVHTALPQGYWNWFDRMEGALGS